MNLNFAVVVGVINSKTRELQPSPAARCTLLAKTRPSKNGHGF
jgi:hypothetical protein